MEGREEEARTILLFALQREDGLISNRLMWVLTLQGMLFAAVALAFRDDGASNPAYMKVLAGLGMSLSFVGVLLSVWANSSINSIRSKWSEIPNVLSSVSPFGSGGHGKGATTNRFGLSVMIPLATFVAWVAVLWLALGHVAVPPEASVSDGPELVNLPESE